MGARTLVLFFLLSAFFPLSAAASNMLYAQSDASAQATRPETDSYPAITFLATTTLRVGGVRFRINDSGSHYVCPGGAVMEYSGLARPDAWDRGVMLGSIRSTSSSTPDAYGNCDYTTRDQYDIPRQLTFTANRYYVFFIGAPYDTFPNWVSVSGAPVVSTSTSAFGHRPRLWGYYIWGTTGLEAAFLELYDGAPPSTAPLDACATPGACSSNVLFLPGIQGSRLYQGDSCSGAGEEKLWEPIADSLFSVVLGAGDEKVRDLFLEPDGTSVCDAIYAKEDGILDSVRGTGYYRPLADELDTLVGNDTINAWKAAPYDWRLSLEDIVSKGAETDGHISYATATNTPYIEQTLRSLAAQSKTGKVSIIAHSNGGLVAKQLLSHLGDEAASLVDKLILVAVPQTGAPAGFAALLYGYDQGIYWHGIPIMRAEVAREMAQNSPMAYHLLPSEDYLESVAADDAHPLARFSGDGYAKEIQAYGSTIGNSVALEQFMLASEGGRGNPEADKLSEAEIANAVLLSYGRSAHSSLEAWVPPSGIEVSQIAGWGNNTLAGIDFYTFPKGTSALTASEALRAYRPILTEDGDGTVTVPSALAMAESENIKRYWINLVGTRIEHAQIFMREDLTTFVSNLLKNSNSLPPTISASEPVSSSGNKLLFVLHSPLTIQVSDSLGNVTGIAIDNAITQAIPGSSYIQLGETQFISVPQGPEYQLSLHGLDSGTFALDIQEYTDGVPLTTTSFVSVPVVVGTTVSLSIGNGITTLSELSVDSDGDGSADITLTPNVGSAVSYQPPSPMPERENHGAAILEDVKIESLVVQTEATSTAFAPLMEPTLSPVPGIDVLVAVASTTPALTATTSIASTTTESIVAAVIKPSAATSDLSVKEVKKIVDSTRWVPQTASVHDAASQHRWFSSLIKAIYTKTNILWSRLRSLM